MTKRSAQELVFLAHEKSLARFDVIDRTTMHDFWIEPIDATNAMVGVGEFEEFHPSEA